MTKILILVSSQYMQAFEVEYKIGFIFGMFDINSDEGKVQLFDLMEKKGKNFDMDEGLIII